MDDAGDDGGQAVVAAGLLLADQVLVGVGDVAAEAGGGRSGAGEWPIQKQYAPGKWAFG